MSQERAGMDASEVHAVLDALAGAGCRCWIAGGWGVDALFGRQTRPHRDLDAAIDASAEDAALDALAQRGYVVETDWRPVRVVAVSNAVLARHRHTGVVATWDDVRRLVAALPETDEHPSYGGHPSWRVRRRAFVWDRPLRRVDRSALGDRVADESEPVLGVHVADEGVKAALIADAPDVFFTTPHFDGYAAVLVRLERIPLPELAELVEDAWRLRAPKRLLAEFERQLGEVDPR